MRVRVRVRARVRVRVRVRVGVRVRGLESVREQGAHLLRSEQAVCRHVL